MSVARFPAYDYDLAATLSSGQAFRWRDKQDRWIGVIGSRWVELQMQNECIVAETPGTDCGWSWLLDYLQLEVNLRDVLSTFPDDPPMRAAVQACQGLRLLRQDPWECLASFILSSTKQ